MRRSLLCVLVLACSPGWAVAQRASLQGIVTAASGGPLEGVAITLSKGGERLHGTFTDRNGFYQIGGIVPTSYSLRAELIGYQEQSRDVTFGPGERVQLALRLATRAVTLEGIVVSAQKGAAVREQGRQVVTPRDIRAVPVPAGAGDLATYLQTLPGVATTSDRGGQVFVRGGTPAENLVLVDGIPIFQPFHILGFFSVFPEDLVSSADFYAGGFGARYHGRTSSVLDVRMRDGNPDHFRTVVSAGPFIAEALAEGPAATGVTWLASVRRSLVEETSSTLLGEKQPLTFDSQLLKVTTTNGDNEGCSFLALRTSDRGRLDPGETESQVGWGNLLLGGRCITQFQRVLRLLEVNFSFSRNTSTAVSRGSSRFNARISRMQHDAHGTSLLGTVPLYAGYHFSLELPAYDLSELFGIQAGDDASFDASGYAEVAIPLGDVADVRPGVVLTASPHAGIEPRLRVSAEPAGAGNGKIQGAFGLYRQTMVGTSDMRDVSSVFTAWMIPPDQVPLEALHALLGWQQPLGDALRWSVEGYYKRLRDIPVPEWRGLAQFATQLTRADGKTYGVDTRVEYTAPRAYGFIGYGYGWTQYEVSQQEFQAWFGQPALRYHPPHDRRHQVNAIGNLELGAYRASVRWQLGTGLPFTRPLGFDEGFDYSRNLGDVHTNPGTTRLLLDRPYRGRLPVMHRLDLSLERTFELSAGKLSVQAGLINAYNRRNMFYYDLFTSRRVDQLPLAPYATVTLRGN